MDIGPLIQEVLNFTNLPILAAFLLGLLASIGPCPLATNVTTLGYMARQFSDWRAVLATGVSYILGRVTAYGLIGIMVLVAGARVSKMAGWLQSVAEIGLGPLLILVGLVLLDLVRPNLVLSSGPIAQFQERIAHIRFIGAFALGIMFALAFCPYSAALYFGILIPLAFKSTAGLTLPLLFGVGTGIPVLVLGIPLALGLKQAAVGLNILGKVEPIIRKVVAFMFIGVGIYLVGRYVNAMIM